MPLPNKVFSRAETFFLQNESSYGIIPNAGGTATVAAANACAMIQFKMNRTADSIVRKDKTGSRTMTAGIAGRQIASWNSNMSLVTNGTAGVAPDADPILTSLFGAPSTSKTGTATITAASNATPISVTAAAHGFSEYDVVNVTGVVGNTAANGIWAIHVVDTNTFTLLGSVGNAAYVSGGSANRTSVVYIPTDAQPSFTGWSFRSPSTAVQRAVFGSVAKQGIFNLGEDIATWQANGDAMWVADSANFGSLSGPELGGLTAFPVMPTNPVVNGVGIAGFKGRAVLNGSTIARIRTAQIKYGSGLDLPRDLFGTAFTDAPEADSRQVFTSFGMYEDDSAGQAALELAAIRKTSLDFVFNIGTVPGSTYVFVIRGIQLAAPDRDDGQRAFTMTYGDSQAYGSGLSAFNEVRVWSI